MAEATGVHRDVHDDDTAAAGDLLPVELDQQPRGRDDPPDRRRVHQRQVSVIVPTQVFILNSFAPAQRGPLRGRQKDWRRGFVLDEVAPSLLRRQRTVRR
ncbi:hypothetical protein AB4039_04595 [Streptomyces sp. M-16]|uniref:hypothetical protein n=1 Tax=Streptomyces sp. M-16 TaxID=3233040 RepID=UPI003F9BFF4E